MYLILLRKNINHKMNGYWIQYCKKKEIVIYMKKLVIKKLER
jgi:hypothetical protein